MSDKHIVVIGGSVTGLAAALVLSGEGHRVTVLEKDATPLPASPLEAFESWDRRGSPQTRHSHAFLARLVQLLRRRAPDLLETLTLHGAEELHFTAMARRAFGRDDLEFEPEDHDITLLACRRITFEWALRRHVIATGRVDFRDGVGVTGLVTEAGGSPPRVTGVELESEGRRSSLSADLVLDASGRRSRLHHWLRDAGAAPLESDSEPCGIFYCSRFYRIREGAEKPELGGVAGSDLGYMKYGIFPGDAGIFSITLCASPDDDPMRRILKAPCFDAATAALPATREWVEIDRSEPISPVHAMGNLANTRKHFVVDGEPIALGVFPVGDALIHTNPLNGRGCTLAFVNAELVAGALADHPKNPRDFALALDDAVTREIVPWYESTRAQDRDSIVVQQEQKRGEDPFAYEREDGSVDPRRYMRALLREGLGPGLREDLHLLRAFMRLFNLLEAPTDLMKNQDLMQRVIASWNRRDTREPVERGPKREEMIACLDEGDGSNLDKE